MRILRKLIVLFAVLAALGPLLAETSLNYLESVAASPAPVAGSQYYTRYNLMYEKGVHLTTNYWRGTLLPINSRVTLVSVGPRKILLRLEGSGDTVTLDNVREYTLKDTATIARELLGADPVPLEKLGAETAAMVKDGYPRKGMTKEQVIMTRGYPPRHKTPSLDSNRWQYWSSRFVVQTLVFENGVLVTGRGT